LDVDFQSTSFSTNSADYKRVNYNNLINFTYEGVLISHINTVKAPNVPLLNSFRSDFQTANGRQPTATEEQTWWAARTSDETGIKGDQFGNVKSFVNNITTSIGTAGAGITPASANNPADALFIAGYTIPQLLNFKREFDGGPITPNTLNAAQLAVQADVAANYGPLFSADGTAGSNVQTKGSGAYYTALNRTDVAPALNGVTTDLSISVKDAAGATLANGVDGPKGNWLLGNFRQTGARDFAAVKEAVNAALSLRAVDGAKNSIYTADGGVAISTVVPSLSGSPGWATTANTKGDLIVLGDANTDGRFDGKDIDFLARGASLSDSGATDQLTIASGPNFSFQVRNPNAKLNKNAALDFAKAATANVSDAGQTFVRTSAQNAQQAANDPSGNNAFNKFDVNRDGSVNRQDAGIVDGFVGKSYTSLDDQLAAVVATNVNAAGTVFVGNPTLDQTTPRKPISLVDVELTDDGVTLTPVGETQPRFLNILRDDFNLLKTQLIASGTLTPGDVDLSGEVNTDDLQVIFSHFGDLYDDVLLGRQTLGELNGDGEVNTFDLTVVFNDFGNLGESLAAYNALNAAQYGVGFDAASGTFYAAAVPEPAALGLIGAGALGLLGRRRRRQPERA
jgi:hypothetical protein